MFEDFKDSSFSAKLLTILVVGILLGLGLCGAGAGMSESYSKLAGVFLTVGAISFWLSLLGLIVAGIVFLVSGPRK